MKVLLTVLASMMITGSAMAACDLKSPQDCSTSSECLALAKDGGAKYTFDDKRTVKCQLVDTSVATDCIQSDDSSRGFSSDATQGSKGTKPVAAPGKQQ